MPKLSFQYNLRSCRKFKYLLFPNTSPVINSLSVYSSSGTNTTVSVYGDNFSLDGRNGTSVVNFGSYTVSVLFYSSQNISFQVPTATTGTYSVTVVNTSQNPLYSNSVQYTIT